MMMGVTRNARREALEREQSALQHARQALDERDAARTEAYRLRMQLASARENFAGLTAEYNEYRAACTTDFARRRAEIADLRALVASLQKGDGA